MDKVAHFQLQCCQQAFFLTQSFIDDTFLPLPLDDFAPGTVRLGDRKKRRKGVNRSMDRMMDLCEKRRLKVPWTPRDHPNCRGYSLDDTRECDQCATHVAYDRDAANLRSSRRASILTCKESQSVDIALG